jgi:hypothetical protein
VKVNILKHACVKTGTVLLAIILLTTALLFFSTQAALAFSPEYVTWQQYSTNPVFDPPNPTENAYYPSIIFDGTTYYMWYDDGSGTRFTTSADGISWPSGAVCTGLTNARHAVVKWVGTEYRVWYWDSSQLYSINDIRTAESLNGVAWFNDSAIAQVGGATVIAGNPDAHWNSGSYGPCDVFYNPTGSGTIITPVVAATVWQNKFVMYYDGTTGGLENIGVAVSADGITWRGYNDGAAPVLAHGEALTDDWDYGFATFCSVQLIDGKYHMWYSGGQSTSHEGIGYAQSTDGVTWTKYTSNPIMHVSDGVQWRLDRTYTPRVLYDASSFSGHGESAQLKMWYNGVDVPDGNYVLGYARIINAAPPTTTTTPVGVGGRVNPVDKTAILIPYIYGLSSITAVIIGALVWRNISLNKTKRRKH